MLIDHGANVNAEGGMYGCALQAGARVGDDKIVQLLIEHGANVNAEGGWYDNALQAASFNGHNGHESTVRLLIKHGADVNAGSGRTLQGAADTGYNNIVQLLLEHGAEWPHKVEEGEPMLIHD
jgi:ankyrin repeat protein